jgi:hypothetical protein
MGVKENTVREDMLEEDLAFLAAFGFVEKELRGFCEV